MNNNFDDDFSDLICSICRTGGDIICCDGRCLRSFHPKCIGLKEEDIPEDSPFVCSDCFSGIQRCFLCCHFGIENELVKCSIPFCGKFYHSECVKTSVDSNNYVCKLHSCDSCGETVINPAKRKNLWRCFRCPKAFDSKHRPRDVHILAEGLFLCIRHTQEEETWPEISKELSNILEARNKSTSSSTFSNSSTTSSSLSSSSSSTQISRNGGSSNDSNGYHTNDLKNRKLHNRINPDETEKERNEREANLRASLIMPKKRPINEEFSETNHNNINNDDDNFDEHTPRFSPVSISEDDNDYNVNHSSNSHLARHNEYRRQRRILWNQSWNEYRDFQDEKMGIRRRNVYNYTNYTNSSISNLSSSSSSSSNFSFITPLNTYSNNSTSSSSSAIMSRTNALLSTLAQQPFSHSSDQYNRQNPSSTTVLMRTSALLSQLTPTNTSSSSPPLSHNSYNQPLHHHHYLQNNNNNNNNNNNQHVNKKIRQTIENTSMPLTSAALSSSTSSSSIPSYGNITLSRTQQLLNQNPIISTTPTIISSTKLPSSTINISPLKNNIQQQQQQPNQQILSRTAQMLAMTSKSSTHSSQPMYHKPNTSNLSTTKVGTTATNNTSISANASSIKSLQNNKMNATDLFAMLQASGLIPPK